MALKKRGFNVDRLLNQEREDRLRVRAEHEDRQSIQRYEKQPEKQPEGPSNPDSNRLTASPTATPPKPTVMNRISSSIMEQVSQKKPFGSGAMMNKMPKIPNQMPGAFNAASSGAGAQPPTQSLLDHDRAGRGQGSAPAPGHTTKEGSLDTS